MHHFFFTKSQKPVSLRRVIGWLNTRKGLYEAQTVVQPLFDIRLREEYAVHVLQQYSA